MLQLLRQTKWTTGHGEPPARPPHRRGGAEAPCPCPELRPRHGVAGGRRHAAQQPAATLLRGPGKLRGALGQLPGVVLFLPGGSELQQHKASEGKKCTPGCIPRQCHPARRRDIPPNPRDPLTCVGYAGTQHPAMSLVPRRPSPSPRTRTIGRARRKAVLAAARPRLALLLLRLHGGGTAALGGPRGWGVPGWAGSSPARHGSTAGATCAGNLTSRRSPSFPWPDVTPAEEWLCPPPSQGAWDRGLERASVLLAAPGAKGRAGTGSPAGGGNDSRLAGHRSCRHPPSRRQQRTPAMPARPPLWSQRSAVAGSTVGKLRQEEGSAP